MRRDFFTAIEAREILLRVIRNRSRLRFRELLPLLARRQLVEGEIDLLHAAFQRAIDGREFFECEPFCLRSQRLAVLHHEFHRPARIWILIRTAAERRERHRAGELALQRLLRAARPVAVNLIDPDRRAVARIARENRAHLSIRRSDAQHRQIVIHRLQQPPSPVRRKPDFAHAPREIRRFAIRERRQRDLLDLVRQFARVPFDRRHVFRRDVHAEKIRQNPREHRRAMRVARCNREPLAAHLRLCREPPQHFIANRGRHAHIVHRHEHRRAFLIAADGERLCKNMLRHAVVRRTPVPIAAEPHGIVRRDVHPRCARELCRIRGMQRRERSEQKNGEEKFHAIEEELEIRKETPRCLTIRGAMEQLWKSNRDPERDEKRLRSFFNSQREKGA